MRCIGCGSAAVTERRERTAQGYRRFRCRACGKQWNERTGTVLNRAQYPSDVIALVAAAEPATPSEAIVVTLDSTFIRSCEAGERHVEVRIGNVETATGRRQVFGAVAKTDTDLAALIRRSLNTSDAPTRRC